MKIDHQPEETRADVGIKQAGNQRFLVTYAVSITGDLTSTEAISVAREVLANNYSEKPTMTGEYSRHPDKIPWEAQVAKIKVHSI
jgi:hypothetical protein